MKTRAIHLPKTLVDRAEERLGEREIELESYIAIHLRIMLKNKNVLNLTDIMPFGKYSGEIVEDVCRVDPDYMSWMIVQNGKTSFAPDVSALVDSLQTKINFT